MFGTASQKVGKMNLTDGDESNEESHNHLAFEARVILATCFGKSDSKSFTARPACKVHRCEVNFYLDPFVNSY